MYLFKKYFYDEDDLSVVERGTDDLLVDYLALGEKTVFTKNEKLWAVTNLKIPQKSEITNNNDSFYRLFRNILEYHKHIATIKPPTNNIAKKYIQLIKLSKENEDIKFMLNFFINMVLEEIVSFDDIMYELLSKRALLGEGDYYEAIIEILDLFSVEHTVEVGYEIFQIPFLYPVEAFKGEKLNTDILNKYFNDFSDKADEISKKLLKEIEDDSDDSSYMENVLSGVMDNISENIEDTESDDRLEELLKIDERVNEFQDLDNKRVVIGQYIVDLWIDEDNTLQQKISIKDGGTK